MNSILITGCSTGLGKELAEFLLDHNYYIYAGLRDIEKLPDWIINHPKKESIFPVKLDLENMNDIEKLQFKHPLKALINNAGICLCGPTELLNANDIQKSMLVNWTAPILLTQKVLPLLRATEGYVIQVGSAAGKIAFPFLGAYASSKFALEAFSDSLRREVSSQGIKVVHLQVGSIHTPIWNKLNSFADNLLDESKNESKKYYKNSVKKFLEINYKFAMKSTTTPKHVSKVVYKILNCKKPCIRYQIGMDAKLNFWATRLLPDRLLDWWIKWMIK